MKNKVLYIFICLILFALIADGQNKDAVFPDGTTVIFENKIASPMVEKSSGKVRVINVLSPMSNTNVVHRVFVDGENKSHFGYDLEVKKEEKGKFTLTFKPLSIILFVQNSDRKTLPKFPQPLQIDEGDTLSVDLMENPKTKEKIADRIKIIQGAPTQNSPSNQVIIPNLSNFPTTEITHEKPAVTLIYSSETTAAPKDFTLDEITMQITNASLNVNGKQMAEKKSVMGGNIYFYLKGKGRFILSPVPHEGFNFQKTGVIDITKISFEMNGDKYEIKSVMPLMFHGGKWNLWVLYDPDYRPNSDVEIEFGGGKIESLIQIKK
ncbi:MAG: hypothetical protein K1X72_23795 [Pyrinomonadaceae bacterium]|nr:hypothetical protein [Pyrinomonadaceae bacterium]